MGDKDYRPTEQDILRARVRTTGILETQFQLKKDVDLRYRTAQCLGMVHFEGQKVIRSIFLQNLLYEKNVKFENLK